MASYSTPTARLQGLYYLLRANHSPHSPGPYAAAAAAAAAVAAFRLLVSKQHSRFFCLDSTVTVKMDFPAQHQPQVLATPAIGFESKIGHLQSYLKAVVHHVLPTQRQIAR